MTSIHGFFRGLVSKGLRGTTGYSEAAGSGAVATGALRGTLPVAGTVLVTTGLVITAFTNAPLSSATTVPPRCSTALHSSYTTAGPDSRTYATWHPAIYKGGKGAQFQSEVGCVFGHEHGDDPTDPKLQTANNSLPAFGYAKYVYDGGTEAHEGYKVVTNLHGALSNQQCKYGGDNRAVFHMGTHAPGRVTQEFHSLQYDYKGFDVGQPTGCDPTGDMRGAELHVSVMSDTGHTSCNGSTASDSGVGSKDFASVHQTAHRCSDSGQTDTFTGSVLQVGKPESAYEAWTNFGFVLCKTDGSDCDVNSAPAFVNASLAVLDPITYVDYAACPASDSTKSCSSTAVPYTQSLVFPDGAAPTDPTSPFLGCDRDAYQAPVALNNAGGMTTIMTDALGHTDARVRPIAQFVSAVDRFDATNQARNHDWCVQGIVPPN